MPPVLRLPRFFAKGFIILVAKIIRQEDSFLGGFNIWIICVDRVLTPPATQVTHQPACSTQESKPAQLSVHPKILDMSARDIDIVILILLARISLKL